MTSHCHEKQDAAVIPVVPSMTGQPELFVSNVMHPDFYENPDVYHDFQGTGVQNSNFYHC